MGMQEKLKREYEKGYKAGELVSSDMAEMRGFVKGSREMWLALENMFTEIEGIGPKTKEKILKAMKKYAQEQKKELDKEIYPKNLFEKAKRVL